MNTSSQSSTLTTAASDFAIDSEKHTLASTWTQYKARLRGGQLGSLPAGFAILVLCLVFGATTEKFISVRNLANLVQQAAPIIVISMAVTFVLLLGEIDLAAGWSAGVVAGVLAVRLKAGAPLIVVIAICLVVAIVLGLFTGFLVARVGIPSFVVTLANFLSFQGLLLLIAKEGGTVGVSNKTIVAIENSNVSVGLSWVLCALTIAGFGVMMVRRQKASRGAIPMSVVAIKVAAVAVIAIAVTQILSTNRAFANANKELKGMPYALPLVAIILLAITFVLNRTAFGRHLFAVGGNQEAARRAGINVIRIRMSAFVLCAVVAGIGGAFLASQLQSISPQTGGNETLLLAVGAAVIGGTSLFGGSGRMFNSVLGGLVIAIINNGLPLVGKKTPLGITEIDFSDSGVKFIVNGLVLLLAASVDALSRKRSAS